MPMIEPLYSEAAAARLLGIGQSLRKAARIRSGTAAALVGVTRKTLLKWARAGIIPGAAELQPRVWSFDRCAIERWVKEREGKTCRTTCTSGKASGTPEFRLEGATSDAAYERLLGLRR